MTALNINTDKVSKNAKKQIDKVADSAKSGVDKVNDVAKSKAAELNKAAKENAAKVNDGVSRQQTVFNGRLTQAKGLVREQLGNLTNNDSMRRAGKRDQVKGALQANYGNSWLVRHSNLVLVSTAVVTVLALLFARRRYSTS